MRFTYTESNLVGDERLVRLSLFNIIWLGVRGIKWPFAVSESDAEAFVDEFASYFPISRSYLGKLELKYFAALVLLRIRKANFAKYDRRYNFLMKNNRYYDFNRLRTTLTADTELTEKQLKENQVLSICSPNASLLLCLEEDPSLQQTLTFYTTKQNPIYPLVLISLPK